MGMRATISEENIRKMVIIAPIVKIERTMNLVMSLMMMMEHVRDLTTTSRVKMVPMMVTEHITHPTPRMKVRRACGNPCPSQRGLYGYTSSSQSHSMGIRKCAYV
ncbi:hypothetical protein H5410_001789 [Solanum commersonii]|uniref:Uncharacterized protein n=1 Tax=Solanum commersonii TaxID=4109 RepID=A0A9J6B016_SOLCO|nr:hypothetical protein H5410_001789 [Solanum commersonii]